MQNMCTASMISSSALVFAVHLRQDPYLYPSSFDNYDLDIQFITDTHASCQQHYFKKNQSLVPRWPAPPENSGSSGLHK
jgi:hypothetical protein